MSLPLTTDRRPAATAAAALPLLAGALVGVAVGALTSLGQSLGALNGTLNPLVNSVSAWVVAAFLLPDLLRLRPGRGALVGAAVCLAEVAGYYLTAHVRGYAAGASALVWAVCAIGAGPIFGALGALRRSAGTHAAAAASAALPALLLAEALGSYALRLHAYDRAAFVAVVGLALAGWLMRGRLALGWLPALAVLLGGVLVLTDRALTLSGSV